MRTEKEMLKEYSKENGARLLLDKDVGRPQTIGPGEDSMMAYLHAVKDGTM